MEEKLIALHCIGQSSGASPETDTEEALEAVTLREQGRTLFYFEAYRCRGALLAHLCLYGYLSIIHLVPRKDRGDDEFHILLDGLSLDVRNWI